MNRIIKRKELLEITGLCYTSIYNKMKQGTFPTARQLGEKSVGWIRQEVQAWIDGLQPAYKDGICTMKKKPTCTVDPLASVVFV